VKFPPKARNAVLVGAVAAVAATAWATNDMMYHSTYVPAYTAPAREPVPEPVVEAPPAIARESLSPNENVVVANEPPPVVVERRSLYQPAITIEQRRLSTDERIQAEVMDRLSELQNISGKIGVESHGAVVRLTGYTATNGQAYRAGREARSVMGVRYVQNEIRPRVGGSV